MLVKFIILLLALLIPQSIGATPDCYRNAANPAHELPFLAETGVANVTALERDGLTCRDVKLYNGAPLLAQKIYVPMAALYESYARALESGNVNAARRAYAWLKPTPRQFPQWLWLANEPAGAPMPWGMDMALKVLRLLESDKAMEKELLQGGDAAMPVLNLQAYWPILYLLMGGEVLPQANPEEWTRSAISASRANKFLTWQSPWADIEEAKNKNNEILLRVR